MKALRVLFSLAVVVSTCLLVGTLAFDKLSGSDSVQLLNLALQAMHLSFLIGSIVFATHQFQQKQRLLLALTIIPVVAFLLAFVGVISGVRPPDMSLLIFDFYLIFYYFCLLLNEMHGFVRDGDRGAKIDGRL